MNGVSENRDAVAATGLWRAFARGVRANFLGEVAVQSLRIGGIVILARKLAPANFGLLRVLLIVGAFASLFCESGIPDALIQREELTPEHEATAWWLSLSLVGVTVTILYCSAPLIARLMAMPRLGFAIRLICLPLLLEGTAIVSVARLSRALKFNALALADVAAEFAFVTTACVLLWRGQSVWSLPGGLAARFAAHASVVWMADRRIPFGRPRLAAARDLGRFAVSVLGGRIITIASANADFLLVGRLLGGTALGYYSMAWDLLRFVPDRLHRVVGRVALPTFCKLRDESQELGSAFCGFIEYLARFILPLAAGVALAAPQLLTTIYGRQWLPAATPMRLLAVGLALAGLRMSHPPVYYAKNYPSLDIFLNGGRLILIALGVIATARIGLAAVSMSVGTVEGLIAIVGQYVVCLLVGLRLRDVMMAIAPSLRVTAVCAIATAVGAAIVTAGGLSGPLALLSLAPLPALAFLWLEGGDLKQMILSAFSRTTLPSAGRA
jgi:O-antigen/teichoic acid export membrane protein